MTQLAKYINIKISPVCKLLIKILIDKACIEIFCAQFALAFANIISILFTKKSHLIQ